MADPTTNILKLETTRREQKKRRLEIADWSIRVTMLLLLAWLTYFAYQQAGPAEPTPPLVGRSTAVTATAGSPPPPQSVISVQTGSQATGVGIAAVQPLNLRPATLWIFGILAPLTSMISIRGFFRAAQTPEYRAEDLWYRMSIFREVAEAIAKGGDASTARGEGVPLLKARFRYLLTCVDKFVDDAQDVLTSRARVYYAFGSSAFLASVGTLHVAGILANRSLERTESILAAVGTAAATHFVVLRIFSSLAVAAAVYAIVKALIVFGSSFFHEATRLLDRRHALRFGRLYIYSRGDDFKFDEMEEAFQWHMESQTVFQGISPTAITDSALSQLTRTVSELAETVTKARKAAAPVA